MYLPGPLNNFPDLLLSAVICISVCYIERIIAYIDMSVRFISLFSFRDRFRRSATLDLGTAQTDAGEFLGIQRCAADQGTINIGHCEKSARIGCFDATTIQDA